MHVALGALSRVTGGPSTYALRLAEALGARGDLLDCNRVGVNPGQAIITWTPW